MKIEERHEFKKSWASVRKMFTDPGYFVKKYELLRCTHVEVLEQETQGDHFRIKVRYDQKPSVPIPSFAQKFVPQTISVTQEDRWNLKTATGRLTIDIRAMPMKIGADMQILDGEDRCTNVLQWTLKSSIPLLGGKLEKLLADDIRTKSAADLAASRTLLKKY